MSQGSGLGLSRCRTDAPQLVTGEPAESLVRTGGDLTGLLRYGPVSARAEGMVHCRYRARDRFGQARAVRRGERR